MPTSEVRDVPADVKDVAQKVWYAGLGALAMAQEEGGKLFSTLVKRGEELEKKAEAPAPTVTATTNTVEDAWKRVQAVLDQQATAALRRLGVPTKDEIGTLTKRIEQLTASIEALKARS